ncbi:MAG: hypothetical protein HY901_33980, partial [Deltaproteobacteria bacterium]|nr:hypothetical protein [Deltaproteobacteria bacterium]
SEARRSISALSQVPGVEVRVITIPPWSGGEIPFARVCHSKYLVVDGRASWVGTSNWEGDYFLKSRNVGVIVEDAAFTERLTRVLDHAWDSPYSKVLEPMTREEPPPKPWKPKGPPEAEQEY